MHLVVVGDSVPGGHGCQEPPWPTLLSRRVGTLEPEDVTVDTAVGRTFADCLDRLADLLDRAAEPPVVLVQAGHNDAQLRGGTPRVPREQFAEAAVRLDERLATTARVRAGAVVGLVPLLPGHAVPFSDDQPDRGLAYDRTLADQVRTHLPVVGRDGPTALDDWATLTVDGVHPNAAGHERIAEAVVPWLSSVL